MTTVSKVGAADLGDLRTGLSTAARNVQKSTVAQGIGRPPVTRLPGRGTFTGRKPFKKRALPFVRGGSPMHEHQPTPHPHALYEPKELLRTVGVPWDFSGTSGCINGYERETAKRSFVQVSDLLRPLRQVTASAGLFRDI